MLNYTIFENHSYNDDSTKLFGGTTHVCQTFTPGTAHTIYVVQVKLIRVGSCGTVTLKVYATDSNSKPTGAALATATVAQGTVGTSAAMVDFTLTSAYTTTNSKLAIVLSAAGVLGTIGWRYKNVGAYTAGEVFSSTDSGVTWSSVANSDFIFAEWGIPLPIYDATRVQLYPRKAGSYTQLQATSSPNWQCVSDPADAPDEQTKYVCYNVTGSIAGEDFNSWFLSGSAESVAGQLTGTKALWRSRYAGLTGSGTHFDTELAADYILTSPTPNAFYPYNHRRIGVVKSIESATALTFDDDPIGNLGVTGGGLSHREFDAAFFTPNCNANAAIPGGDRFSIRPWNYLTGQWTFTNGSKTVTGSGGAALTELIQHAWVEAGPYTTPGHRVSSVTNNNEFELLETYTHATVTNDGSTDKKKTRYCTFSWYDDLTSASTATLWATKTKKDSYLVKKTQISGNIRQMEVVFRVCFYDKQLGGTVQTATAQPFLRLNSTDSLGTEVTLTSFASATDSPDEDFYNFKTYRQIISRPGGGVFTKDDLESLEVGIILGNVSSYVDINRVICTQLYIDAVVSANPWLESQTIGMTQYGFKTFANRLDEWAMPTFSNGMNMLAHKIYRESNLTFFAKPIQVLRGVTSRLLGRRRTSAVFNRMGTSGSITQ